MKTNTYRCAKYYSGLFIHITLYALHFIITTLSNRHYCEWETWGAQRLSSCQVHTANTMIGQDLNQVLTPESSPLTTVAAGFPEATNRTSVHPWQSQMRTWRQTIFLWPYWPGHPFSEEDVLKISLPIMEQFLIASFFSESPFLS